MYQTQSLSCLGTFSLDMGTNLFPLFIGGQNYTNPVNKRFGDIFLTGGGQIYTLYPLNYGDNENLGTKYPKAVYRAGFTSVPPLFKDIRKGTNEKYFVPRGQTKGQKERLKILIK